MKTIFNARAVITAVAILLSLIAKAQFVTFEKDYNTQVKHNQSGRDIIETTDRGFIIVGMTRNNIAGDSDIYILKTNNLGDTLWSKTYGGTQPDYPHSITTTNDGNYFVVGFTRSFGSGLKDIYLLKIDPSGNLIWSKTYGQTGNDAGKEIIHTSDGNFVIAGSSNYNAFLMKIDGDGTVQ